MRDEMDAVSAAASTASFRRSRSWPSERRQAVSRSIRSWAPCRKSPAGSHGDDRLGSWPAAGGPSSSLPFIVEGDSDGMLQLRGECLSVWAKFTVAAMNEHNELSIRY